MSLPNHIDESSLGSPRPEVPSVFDQILDEARAPTEAERQAAIMAYEGSLPPPAPAAEPLPAPAPRRNRSLRPWIFSLGGICAASIAVAFFFRGGGGSVLPPKDLAGIKSKFPESNERGAPVRRPDVANEPVVAPVRVPLQEPTKAGPLDIRTPRFDAQGRIWLYGAPVENDMPYASRLLMPGEAAAMLRLDTASTTLPYAEEDERAGAGRCMELTITWQAPHWCVLAFVSGPDSPPWWGDDQRGWYYDLRQLQEKRLVFFARGESGDERIEVKLGILGDKPFGDSLSNPVSTGWVQLSKEWRRFVVDLSSLKPAELARVCNGFTVVASRDQQEGQRRVTRFWLDSIYLK